MHWLGRFLPRLVDRLNLGAGLAGIVAIVLGFAALQEDGFFRLILLILALVVLVPMLFWIVVPAIPPRLRSLPEVEGQDLLIEDLRSLDPPVATLGIVGPSQVGKTTLRNLLLQRQPSDVATQRLTAVVSCVLQNPATYMAILDGKGQTYAQQFEVASAARVICVMLDHNPVDGQDSVNELRLNAHRDFGTQVREFLIEGWRKRPPKEPVAVHVLLNKRDEWQLSDGSTPASLSDLLEAEASAWRALPQVAAVSTSLHSNASVENVINLTQNIRRLLSQIPSGVGR